MSIDALTDAQLACLLVVAGQDRPVAERELWVPRARVEYDHGPAVVAELMATPLLLVVAWSHPDGEQLCLTDAGGRCLGLAIDEKIDLKPVEDVDDEGRAIRYDVLLKRDCWVAPPTLERGRKWGFRLPAREGMFPLPDPSAWPAKGRTPLEELIDAEAWSNLLGTRVKVDPATGELVEAAKAIDPRTGKPTEDAPTPRPAEIMGVPVRVGRGRRAG